LSDRTKPALQPRTLRTRANLIDALEKLLKTREFEQISVADIAAKAGVSVGSVYSHFKDKDAFLEELLLRRKATIEERLLQSEATDMTAVLKAQGDLHTALLLVSRSAFEQVRMDAHIIRATHTYARLNPEFIDEDWQAFADRSFSSLRLVLDIYADQITRPDMEEAAKMINYFFSVIFVRTALFQHGTLFTSHAPSDEALVREAADMAYGYLCHAA